MQTPRYLSISLRASSVRVHPRRHLCSPCLISPIGNSQRPQLTQTNKVNVYLWSPTEQTILLQWNNLDNPTGQAGVRRAQVNDSWWGARGNTWSGTDIPFLFQWAITRADETFDGSVQLQPIFTALRTYLVLAAVDTTKHISQRRRSPTRSLPPCRRLRLLLPLRPLPLLPPPQDRQHRLRLHRSRRAVASADPLPAQAPCLPQRRAHPALGMYKRPGVRPSLTGR